MSEVREVHRRAVRGEGMIRLKEGVNLNGTQGEAFEIMVAAREAFGFFGADAIITSGQDGKHGKGSLHGAGYALDFRIRHVSRVIAEKVVERMRKALGKDYDIVLEKDHIHGEWDKK